MAVKVDGTDDTPAFQALTKKYGVVGMPTVVLIDGRGRELPVRITATVAPEEMAGWLAAVDRVCVSPAVACAARW